MVSPIIPAWALYLTGRGVWLKEIERCERMVANEQRHKKRQVDSKRNYGAAKDWNQKQKAERERPRREFEERARTVKESELKRAHEAVKQQRMKAAAPLTILSDASDCEKPPVLGSKKEDPSRTRLHMLNTNIPEPTDANIKVTYALCVHRVYSVNLTFFG